ncbi:PUA-like domain-containing protein [Crassisporium funariophilum]|nr:PUA-like domain-containing protein [Crassisporium funariophilum]
MSPMSTSGKKYWLLKAEPDTRIVKGKDVKFSVEDFERVKTSPWEGVRNYEARNLMREMKLGDKALFYHSNCKTPGIAAFAQVSKEAYPDYTAWDASHPYYDPKSNSDDPKWFMVDLTFSARGTHFVPLALMKYIADLPPQHLPEEIAYIGDDGVKAIKGMDLVRKGRLSVQRVQEDAWVAVGLLAEKGGWEEMDLKPKKKPGKEMDVKAKETVPGNGKAGLAKNRKIEAGKKGQGKKRLKKEEPEEEEDGIDSEEEEEGEEGVQTQLQKPAATSTAKRKRERTEEDVGAPGLRRSTRTKR